MYIDDLNFDIGHVCIKSVWPLKKFYYYRWDRQIMPYIAVSQLQYVYGFSDQDVTCRGYSNCSHFPHNFGNWLVLVLNYRQALTWLQKTLKQATTNRNRIRNRKEIAVRKTALIPLNQQFLPENTCSSHCALAQILTARICLATILEGRCSSFAVVGLF